MEEPWKTIGAHLSFRRQAEVDQRTQTQDLEANKIGVCEAGQIVRAIYQSPSSAPAITSGITAEVTKIRGAFEMDSPLAAGRRGFAVTPTVGHRNILLEFHNQPMTLLWAREGRDPFVVMQ
jgi:hypothetical protein